MRQHEADQLVVVPFGIAQTKFGIGRALFTEQCPHRNAHRLDEFDQPRAIRRMLQLFDHHGFLPALLDHRQGVARGAAVGIVISFNSPQSTVGLDNSSKIGGGSWALV
jgi:hypothetical protein